MRAGFPLMRVEPEPDSRDCSNSDDEITLVVRDQRPGLSASERVRILERFNQAENSITRQHGGLGLGLPTTQNMVRAHKDGIWVESELGKGSAFYIRLHRRTVPDP